MNEDYYKILGVAKAASEEDIKTAYRKLAHKYHPDKSGGDEKMFKKINEAYQVLSSREKRAQYDRFGRTFASGEGFGGGSPFGADGAGGFSAGGGFPFGADFRNFGGGEWEFNFGGAGGEDFTNMSDVFDAFFEGMGVKRKRRSYEHGADLEYAEAITLEEAFRGAKKTIIFKTYAPCHACGGVGHFPKDGFAPCSACDGRGEVQESRRGFFGNFTQVKTCGRCNGLGKIPNKACAKCSGGGRTSAEKQVEIAIAPGIADGQLIKVAGAGEAGPHGAAAGDLYVRVSVKKHPLFARSGDDLILKQQANFADLLISRSVEVPTISGGKIPVHIPPGFRIGDQLAVSGEGMPHLGSFGRGNLRIDLEVKLPKHISDRAKKLLEELKKELE